MTINHSCKSFETLDLDGGGRVRVRMTVQVQKWSVEGWRDRNKVQRGVFQEVGEPSR